MSLSLPLSIPFLFLVILHLSMVPSGTVSYTNSDKFSTTRIILFTFFRVQLYTLDTLDTLPSLNGGDGMCQSQDSTADVYKEVMRAYV